MSSPLALIIEDDPDAAVIFSQALKVTGFASEVIPSGTDACNRLAHVQPSLVLLDMHLPQVAGTEILNYIRSSKRLAGTRVVIVSADARMADSVAAQADLVLLKPISFSQVRDLVARLNVTIPPEPSDPSV